VSVYVKKETNTNATLVITDNGSANTLVRAYINLDTGVVTNVTGTTISVSAGNGWYRVHSTYTYTSPLNRIYFYPGILSDTSTGGIYLWGAQLEAGAFPTSYIKTEAATATRAADIASITGTNFSSWFDPAKGALYAEAVAQNFTATNFARIASFDRADNTANFIAIPRSNGLNRIEYSVFATTGQAVGLQPFITFGAGAIIRSALIYQVNDFIMAANGVLSIADTSGVLPTALTALGIGQQGSGNLQYNGHIRRLTFWPQRLPNTSLQSITQ
jgi:hypothetical protein